MDVSNDEISLNEYLLGWLLSSSDGKYLLLTLTLIFTDDENSLLL